MGSWTLCNNSKIPLFLTPCLLAPSTVPTFLYYKFPENFTLWHQYEWMYSLFFLTHIKSSSRPQMLALTLFKKLRVYLVLRELREDSPTSLCSHHLHYCESLCYTQLFYHLPLPLVNGNSALPFIDSSTFSCVKLNAVSYSSEQPHQKGAQSLHFPFICCIS